MSVFLLYFDHGCVACTISQTGSQLTAPAYARYYENHDSESLFFKGSGSIANELKLFMCVALLYATYLSLCK